jgi:hypothetical protein
MKSPFLCVRVCLNVIVFVCVPHPINFLMPKPISLKLGMHINVVIDKLSISNTNITASQISEAKPYYCLTPASIFMDLGIYIIPHETISKPYS